MGKSVYDLGSGDGRIVITAARRFPIGTWQPEQDVIFERTRVYFWSIPRS